MGSQSHEPAYLSIFPEDARSRSWVDRAKDRTNDPCGWKIRDEGTRNGMNPRRTSTSPEAFRLRVSRNKRWSAEYLNVEPRKGWTSKPITGNPGGKTTANKDQLSDPQKMNVPPLATHPNPMEFASVILTRRISISRMGEKFELHILTSGNVLEPYIFSNFKNNRTIRKPTKRPPD